MTCPVATTFAARTPPWPAPNQPQPPRRRRSWVWNRPKGPADEPLPHRGGDRRGLRGRDIAGGVHRDHHRQPTVKPGVGGRYGRRERPDRQFSATAGRATAQRRLSQRALRYRLRPGQPGPGRHLLHHGAAAGPATRSPAAPRPPGTPSAVPGSGSPVMDTTARSGRCPASASPVSVSAGTPWRSPSLRSKARPGRRDAGPGSPAHWSPAAASRRVSPGRPASRGARRGG